MNASDLHDTFERLAGHAADPTAEDTSTLLAGVRRRGRRRRTAVRVVASGVAVAVLAVAGVVAIAQRGDGRTQVVSVAHFGLPLPAATGPSAEAWETGKWTDLPKPPVDFGSASRAFWVGGRLVVVQPQIDEGKSIPTPWVGATFDPDTNEWIEVSATPSALGPGANVAATGDRLLVWGGGNPLTEGDHRSFEPSRVAFVLDPTSATWHRVAAPPSAATPTSVSAWTGKRLVMVGAGSATSGMQLVSYDPAADGWTVIDARPLDRADPSSILWTGTDLLVWFDYLPPADGPGWQHLERYDPTRNTWSRVAGDDGRPAVTDVAMVDGKIVGREVATPCGMCVMASQGRTVTIDPATGAWSAMAAAPTTYLPNNRPQIGGSLDPGSRQIVIGMNPVRVGLVVDPKRVGVDGTGPGTWPMTVKAYDASGHRWVEAVRPSHQLRPIVKDDLGPFTGSPQLLWTGRSLVVWGTFDCIDTADCAQPTSTFGLFYTPGK